LRSSGIRKSGARVSIQNGDSRTSVVTKLGKPNYYPGPCGVIHFPDKNCAVEYVYSHPFAPLVPEYYIVRSLRVTHLLNTPVSYYGIANASVKEKNLTTARLSGSSLYKWHKHPLNCCNGSAVEPAVNRAEMGPKTIKRKGLWDARICTP
jgi:hypothetical protein